MPTVTISVDGATKVAEVHAGSTLFEAGAKVYIADIADALGIRSRQGAQQRYRRLITATEHTNRRHPPRPRPHRRPAGE